MATRTPRMGSSRSGLRPGAAGLAALLALAPPYAALQLPGFYRTLFVFLLLLLSRIAPVAWLAGAAAYITPAASFAALLLLGPRATALAVIVACAVAAARRRAALPSALWDGARSALACLAAGALHPSVADSSTVPAAALLFAAVEIALQYLDGQLASENRDRLTAAALVCAAGLPAAAAGPLLWDARGWSASPWAGGLAVVALAAIRLAAERRSLVRQVEAVDSLAKSCAKAVTAEASLGQLLSLARGLVPYDRAVLWLEEEVGGGLQPRAWHPEVTAPPDADVVQPETLLARTLRRAEPALVRDAARDPRLPQGSAHESWILFPIPLYGRGAGLAQLVRSQPFTWREINLLAPLISAAGIAIESARVRHQMHRYADMAITDGLTGLINHRRAMELLALEANRAGRYQRPLSVMMIDVDTFKKFNDTYGHPQGDRLLQAIATLLRSSVRSVDYVGRYGGEEFILILPETALEDARALAERIRQTIAEEQFPTGGGGTVRKTVSIGLAGFPQDAVTPDELVRHADEALYRAKRSGRNKVLTAGA